MSWCKSLFSVSLALCLTLSTGYLLYQFVTFSGLLLRLVGGE